MFRYKSDVRYKVMIDGKCVLETEAAGIQPITGVVRGAAGRLLRGLPLQIEGDDRSIFIVQGVHGGVAPDKLTLAAFNFFWCEINNKRERGESPATIDTVWGTLHSGMDTCDVAHMCGDPCTVYDDASVSEFVACISELRSKYGGDWELRTLIHAHERAVDGEN
jgi:hypothetical protein